MTGDRPLYGDIEAVATLLATRSLSAAVEGAVGPLT
jgi:hypothetical protein